MPGICGLISRLDPTGCASVLKVMTEAMLHEASCSSGQYENADLGAYVGWACHPGTFVDCMPVANEKRNVFLVLWGEEFTDGEVLKKLRAQNHRFDKLNASYLVHLYEERGLDFLGELNGWFSGVLIDLREKRVILFNDRYGLGKVLFYEKGDSFFFASEAGCLARVCPEVRDVEMATLADIWCCEGELGSETLFKGVSRLPGGAAWEFSGRGLDKKRRYFEPSTLQSRTVLEKDFYGTRVNETFERCLPKYFRSEGPIGISLIGGVGTRMIMKHVDRSSDRILCYASPQGHSDKLSEGSARRMMSEYKVSARILPIRDNFFREFPQYAEKAIYFTDGCCGVTASLEVYLSRVAREIAPVQMNALYGSELLRLECCTRGTEAFVPEFKVHLENSRTKVNALMKMDPLEFTFFKAIPRHMHALECARSELIVRCPFMDNDVVALAFRAPVLYEKMDLFSVQSSALSNSVSCARIMRSARKWVAEHLKCCQAVESSSGRVSFSGSRSAVGSSTYGSGDFRKWFRGELSGYVKEILLDGRTLRRSFLDRKGVVRLVDDHMEGRKDHTTTIAKLITLELVQRLLIETGRG